MNKGQNQHIQNTSSAEFGKKLSDSAAKSSVKRHSMGASIAPRVSQNEIQDLA
jgi:hypothetical protein